MGFADHTDLWRYQQFLDAGLSPDRANWLTDSHCSVEQARRLHDLGCPADLIWDILREDDPDESVAAVG